MTLCVVVVVLLIVLFILGRKKISGKTGKMMAIAAMSAILGIAAGLTEDNETGLAEGKYLKRNEAGKGSYTQDLTVTVEGLFEDYPYSLEVEEQTLTKEEEDTYLDMAVCELEQEFLGENQTFDEVRGSVVIRKTYQNGLVAAEWSFDQKEIIDANGLVTKMQLPDQGVAVKAEVLLTCGTSVRKKEIGIRVFGTTVSEKDRVLADLNKELQTRMGQGDVLELPRKIGEYRVYWEEEKKYLPEKVFFLGSLLMFLVPLLERSNERERTQKRKWLLMLEYPDMVSKLAILLGAGMTLSKAFHKIAFSYEEKRKKREVREMPVYEEMLVTCREMENGVGEVRAYLHFGERCGISEYRKLAKILGQNLKKGGRETTLLLTQEAEDALEKRKNTAKRLGEEAGTKLLFPMIIMLGIILVILMIPAMYALNI